MDQNLQDLSLENVSEVVERISHFVRLRPVTVLILKPDCLAAVRRTTISVVDADIDAGCGYVRICSDKDYQTLAVVGVGPASYGIDEKAGVIQFVSLLGGQTCTSLIVAD